jgi:hypothetical protein
LAEVFFFGSSLFLFQFQQFFLDQWLFGLLAFAFVARVHLFVHPLFSLYTSILATPYESVGGCYSIHVDKYSNYSLHLSTFVYVYYVSEATRMTSDVGVSRSNLTILLFLNKKSSTFFDIWKCFTGFNAFLD